MASLVKRNNMWYVQYRQNGKWVRISCKTTVKKIAQDVLNQYRIAEAHDIFSETIQEFLNDKSEIGIIFNVEGMAGLYMTVGKAEQAARLIGWANRTREKINNTRPPIEQAEIDKVIAACIVKLGEAIFSDAYEVGKKMSLDEAVAHALQKN